MMSCPRGSPVWLESVLAVLEKWPMKASDELSLLRRLENLKRESRRAGLRAFRSPWIRPGGWSRDGRVAPDRWKGSAPRFRSGHRHPSSPRPRLGRKVGQDRRAVWKGGPARRSIPD